jgi:hypothetical protein
VRAKADSLDHVRRENRFRKTLVSWKDALLTPDARGLGLLLVQALVVNR